MKILLITYYFPPCGGAPVQRWLRFLPHLLRRGHQITVVTSTGGDYPFIDESLCEKIPPEVRVIRVPALKMAGIWQKLTRSGSDMPYGKLPAQPKGLSQILVWLRLNLIIPDLRVFWNPKAMRACFAELSQKPYDTIITTGPPHSTHLIGLKLAARHNLKWFADFRDPFSQIHYLKLNPPCRLSLAIYKYLENEVVSSANCNLVVSEAIADALPAGRKLVVNNGYDPQDFAGIEYSPAESMRIKYIGQFTQGQDIGLIADLCSRLSRPYTLSLIGSKIGEKEAEQLRAKTADKLNIVPFVSHARAVQEMVQSELLLLIVNDYEGNHGMLTTKLFEYLASRTPILCFSSDDTAAARIIGQSEAGKSFDYQQIFEAAVWVDQLVIGSRMQGNIFAYSVEHQIDKLDTALRS
ncbi:MAG: glycosyltransferase [Candidatus Cloacimonadaceae bacterium]|jgi:glycosyltransferase involved in cell wall biosynthesis|nr:glycosyl transferase [Candidatus Cloacimonadota bacterium]MDY0126641.1 glycosyltransferase [Candidatus Cloacimonadaceae bacterium]MCB5255254.1 glycosyl transferase [Candidatus Cloacimonadota bacterium]MCK9177476.1 glycosyl transferase [Candidatus Cloacimonadota bacterium]MCK9242740.1 glycosyl transferase [Candidatus Cloacimonadota bacterium]